MNDTVLSMPANKVQNKYYHASTNNASWIVHYTLEQCNRDTFVLPDNIYTYWSNVEVH